MTEAEWLAFGDPGPMLDFLRGKASDRKLRLFIVVCCRHLQSSWESPPVYNEFLEWAELFADGAASSEDLASIGEAVALYLDDYAPDWWTGIARAVACAVHLPRADPFGIRQATLQVLRYDQFPGEDRAGLECEEFTYQAAVLRDLVGPFPFRPMSLDPGWLTWNSGAIPKLAQAIYDERRFADLPILADALEEAGCTHADILDHCRRPGEHVRGCWVVDLLLSKE
jgi:hypothetical protein